MLMAFDAAARMGSFTLAAQALNLTQGAISRQVVALEKQLNVLLFERIRKTIRLTEAGRVYAAEVNKALQVIRNASLKAMTNPLGGTLNLAILPTFGTRWLMPRFPDFLKKYPDITVNFVTRLSPFDFHGENLHAAIHYGSPDWPETISTFLMGEEVQPFCSPAFLAQYPISDPGDLLPLPLLHLATRPQAWNEWFEFNDLVLPAGQAMLFEQISTLSTAAAAGLGVALLPKFLVQTELDRDELVMIMDLPLKSSYGYYLIIPIDKTDYAPVAAFSQWLLDVVKGDCRI
jgi:DNA-binding transcriptional LysR family regulator